MAPSLHLEGRFVPIKLVNRHNIGLTPRSISCEKQNKKRGHDKKFQIPFSRIQSHQNSYFPSAIGTWNNFPAVLFSVPTLEAFKVGLVHV
jgi:hypothetical protein